MNRATKEYIEFFGLYEQIEKVLDNFFNMLSESMDKEQFEYCQNLRTSFDMSKLVDDLGVSLEAEFSQEDLVEIVALYRQHPVLLKLMRAQEALFAAQQLAAQQMVAEAAQKMPFLVGSGEC